MQQRPPDNPFTILEIGVDASTREVVRRGKDLDLATFDDESKRITRWAVDQLKTHPMVRLEHELFEVPKTQYRNPDADRFFKSFQHCPINTEALTADQEPPSMEDFDISALLEMILKGWLAAPVPRLHAALDDAPVDQDLGTDSWELNDDIFG